MSFTTKHIPSQKIAIIDIWSYKIRVAICKIKNCDIELVWYAEKRQDSRHTKYGEILDLEWVCEDIKIAVDKAQKDAGMTADNIIIGTPFSETYFSGKKINHVRKYPERDMDKKELFEIVEITQKKAINSYMKEIENSVAYKRSDLQLISSQIEKIKIDSRVTKKTIWEKGNSVTLFLSNIFIPKHKAEILSYISSFLGKEIVKIIPGELSLAHLFEDDKEIILIDIWNTHTSIVVKQKWYVQWVRKISIGMDDLIKNIALESEYTKNFIIENIDSDEFGELKEKFLSIFLSSIALVLEDILWDEICPNKFFLLGGWANKFILDAFTGDNLRKYHIKVANNTQIIKTKKTYFGEMYSKSKASIIAMMIASKDIFAYRNSPLWEALKAASKNI